MIYLDNCATTKMRQEVAQKMYESACEDFGNPSSLHRLGMLSEKKITEVRQLLAQELGVSEKELYFTSGGTEGNNLALTGAVRKMGKRGKRILTTKIEHPSVLNPMRRFEEEGFEVCYLSVDESGRVNLEEFQRLLNEETILVSVMQVNNEIGTIQPLEEIGEILARKRKSGETSALFHIDGVQGFMKLPIRPKAIGADFYTASAHKIHGPKGVGLLYIRKDSHDSASYARRRTGAGDETGNGKCAGHHRVRDGGGSHAGSSGSGASSCGGSKEGIDSRAGTDFRSSYQYPRKLLSLYFKCLV